MCPRIPEAGAGTGELGTCAGVRRTVEWGRCTGVKGQVRCGGGGVPWCLVVVTVTVLVLSSVVTRVRCQERTTTIEDCRVQHLREDDSSPRVAFKPGGEVVVGILPQSPGEVLAGLTFTVTTSTTSVILRVSVQDPNTATCWMGSFLEGSFKGLPSLVSEDSYDVRHVSLALKEGRIFLNGTLDVCPKVKIQGSNPSLAVYTVVATNVVFNCHDGCPIFSDYALAAYARNNKLPKTDVFMRLGSRGKGQVKLARCNGGTETLTPDLSPTTWDPLLMERDERGQRLTVRVGTYRKDLPADGEICPALDLRASRGLEWTIGCDPRINMDEATVAPSPSGSLNLVQSPKQNQKLLESAMTTETPEPTRGLSGLASGRTSDPTLAPPPCSDSPPATNKPLAAVVSGWMATGVMVVISVGLAAYVYMLKGENDRLKKNGDAWSMSGEIPLNVPLSLKFSTDTPTPPGCIQTTPKRLPSAKAPHNHQNGGPNLQNEEDFVVVHPKSASSSSQPPAGNSKAAF